MIILITAASVLAFIIAFSVFGIVPRAQKAIGVAQSTTATMRDQTLDDEAKETAVQAASLMLLKQFFGLLVFGILTLVAAYIPLFLADMAGLAPAQTVLDFMLRLDVILITSAVLIALVVGFRRFR